MSVRAVRYSNIVVGVWKGVYSTHRMGESSDSPKAVMLSRMFPDGFDTVNLFPRVDPSLDKGFVDIASYNSPAD